MNTEELQEIKARNKLGSNFKDWVTAPIHKDCVALEKTLIADIAELIAAVEECQQELTECTQVMNEGAECITTLRKQLAEAEGEINILHSVRQVDQMKHEDLMADQAKQLAEAESEINVLRNVMSDDQTAIDELLVDQEKQLIASRAEVEQLRKGIIEARLEHKDEVNEAVNR